jgi:hypothetical protein
MTPINKQASDLNFLRLIKNSVGMNMADMKMRNATGSLPGKASGRKEMDVRPAAAFPPADAKGSKANLTFSSNNSINVITGSKIMDKKGANPAMVATFHGRVVARTKPKPLTQPMMKAPTINTIHAIIPPPNKESRMKVSVRKK